MTLSRPELRLGSDVYTLAAIGVLLLAYVLVRLVRMMGSND